MRSAPVALRWYFWFKVTVFTLLACNAAVFLLTGTASEALDTVAWLVLLALFELETGHGNRLRGGRAASVVRGTRLVAATGVVAAALGYMFERDWLDAVNSLLWIAVVVILEFEVRNPHAVDRHRAWFAAGATTLYAGLGVLVLVWAWRGEWFDAYDALLWLIAFVTIEIDVLQVSRVEHPGNADVLKSLRRNRAETRDQELERPAP